MIIINLGVATPHAAMMPLRLKQESESARVS